MTDTTELDKNKQDQEGKKVGNPTGKGGFGDNPDNINKGGRPKNEVSITYWIKKFLAENEPGHDKQRAQELAEKIVVMAYKDGNVVLIKELLNRIEGTNPIRFDSEREDIRDILAKVYAEEENDKDNPNDSK